MQSQILEYAQTALLLTLRLSLVPIAVATLVGLLVSLLQALTQVQEQTLGFTVKLIAIAITLLFTAQWMGGELLLFAQQIFTQLPRLILS